MSIELVPYPAEELDRLEGWLAAPHVDRWWKRRWSDPVIAAFRAGEPPPAQIRPWRIDVDGRPVGYAQDCVAAWDAEIWGGFDEVDAGTRAVDLLIGEADAVNRKLGRAALRTLTARLFEDPAVDRTVAGPQPDNWPAIIACKRAGFRDRGRRLTAAGPMIFLTAAKSVWQC